MALGDEIILISSSQMRLDFFFCHEYAFLHKFCKFLLVQYSLTDPCVGTPHSLAWHLSAIDGAVTY